MREKLLPKLTVSEGGKGYLRHTQKFRSFSKKGMLNKLLGQAGSYRRPRRKTSHPADVMRGYLGNTKQDGYIWVRIRNYADVTPSPTILLSVHL